MLKEIHVKNYALIGDAHIEFAQGLHVFTGETGAGKSLLAGALGLLMGHKPSENVIRYGAKQAEVLGIVEVKPETAAAIWLKQHDIELDGQELTVQRLVRSQGRSYAYLQAQPVTQQALEELMSLLFDMHGQHESQSLYQKENQRKILDTSAGLQKEVQQCQELFHRLKQQQQDLKDWQDEQIRLKEEQDYLTYSLQEIEEFQFRVDEKEDLQKKIKTLESGEKISQSLENFFNLMRGQDGALQKLKEAQNALYPVSSLLKEEDRARFASAIIEIEDVVETFLSLSGDSFYSREDLETLNTRLLKLQRLEKKYGGNSEAVCQFAENARMRLDKIEMGEAEQERLEKLCKTTEQELLSLAQEISTRRQSEAKKLQEEVQQILHELGMPSAHFEIQVQQRRRSDGQRSVCATGIDDVEFLFVANLGHPLKPLKTIASGGEASRVLLALKSVLAVADEIDCLIFDEIDTGVGGNAALTVARHMQRLAKHKQVLCITHLAVIAAHADWQICLLKKEQEGNTITDVFPIMGEDRVKEIARMLSGRQDAIACEHARALLENSHKDYS